jgi:hypothetical protein
MVLNSPYLILNSPHVVLNSPFVVMHSPHMVLNSPFLHCSPYDTPASFKSPALNNPSPGSTSGITSPSNALEGMRSRKTWFKNQVKRPVVTLRFERRGSCEWVDQLGLPVDGSPSEASMSPFNAANTTPRQHASMQAGGAKQRAHGSARSEISKVWMMD